jgi:lactate dehydrogenase-like 2-hydroxyacid dehydrogenase
MLVDIGESSIDEELIKLDNALLTHVVWYTVEFKRALRTKAMEDTLRALRNEKPTYPVPQ